MIKNELLICGVRQKSNVTCTLDSLGQLTLMSSAGTGHAAGQDLAALGHVLLQLAGIFIVNVCNLIYAECAYLATATAALRALCTLRTGSNSFLVSSMIT